GFGFARSGRERGFRGFRVRPPAAERGNRKKLRPVGRGGAPGPVATRRNFSPRAGEERPATAPGGARGGDGCGFRERACTASGRFLPSRRSPTAYRASALAS